MKREVFGPSVVMNGKGEVNLGKGSTVFECVCFLEERRKVREKLLRVQM
jgi:hypothetical protein